MIDKCQSALTFVCLYAVICNSCANLSLSDLTPYYTVPPEKSEREITTKQEDNSLHKWRDDHLRAALCPDHHIHLIINDIIRCTDKDSVFLSIGHCLTSVNENGTNVLYEFKCPYFQLEGHNYYNNCCLISEKHTQNLVQLDIEDKVQREVCNLSYPLSHPWKMSMMW